MKPGRFLVLEGLDAVGKSTQAQVLAQRLDAVLTREPGGTAIGGRVRELVLGFSTIGLADRAEALLMAADRAQHAQELIGPALAAGRHVISDRYLYSSVAYQGYGRGLDPGEIAELSRWATDGLEPDLVILLEGPARRSGATDRLEAADDAFRERVRDGYRRQAAGDPARWAVVEVHEDSEATAARLWAVVSERLPELGDEPGRAR